jgi:hypothetical protein
MDIAVVNYQDSIGSRVVCDCCTGRLNADKAASQTHRGFLYRIEYINTGIIAVGKIQFLRFDVEPTDIDAPTSIRADVEADNLALTWIVRCNGRGWRYLRQYEYTALDDAVGRNTLSSDSEICRIIGRGIGARYSDASHQDSG